MAHIVAPRVLWSATEGVIVNWFVISGWWFVGRRRRRRRRGSRSAAVHTTLPLRARYTSLDPSVKFLRALRTDSSSGLIIRPDA